MKLFLIGAFCIFNFIFLSVKGKNEEVLRTDGIEVVKEVNGVEEITEIEGRHKRRHHKHKHSHSHKHRHSHKHEHKNYHKHKDTNREDDIDDANVSDDNDGEIVYYENTHGLNVHKKCKHSGMVALTFDDGVMPETPQILDILSKNGVKATFFILASTVDHYPTYKTILHRIVNEGHTLGSHTYSHSDLTGLGAEGIKTELNQAAKVFENACGERPKFMRPPYGSVNSEVMAVSSRMGYEVVHWNVDTNDWRSPYDTTPIIDSLYHHEDGSMTSKIVLMHDKPITVQALDSIIKFYTMKGYTFVNMEKCLGMKGYF